MREKRQEIQEEEYRLPYHYKDVFAPGQSVERNSIFSFVVETFRQAGKGHVIDVGCGDGRFCFFAKNYLSVEGLDISERALVWARAFNPEIVFHDKRIAELRLRGVFDGSVALEVLEHIPDDDIPAFIGGSDPSSGTMALSPSRSPRSGSLSKKGISGITGNNPAGDTGTVLRSGGHYRSQQSISRAR